MRLVGLLPFEHLFDITPDRVRIHQLPRQPLGVLGVYQFRNLGKPIEPHEGHDHCASDGPTVL